MTMIYSNPKRAEEAGALPDVETWKGYMFTCAECGAGTPLSANYYGTICFDTAACDACGEVGTLDNYDGMEVGWYWQSCFPGCLPDGEANGPFDTEAEAIADGQSDAQDTIDGERAADYVRGANDPEHEHVFGPFKPTHFTGEPRRGCQVPGCKFVSLDGDDDEDDTDDELPQCVLAMGCLCAGHARGNPAGAECDTTE